MGGDPLGWLATLLFAAGSAGTRAGRCSLADQGRSDQDGEGDYALHFSVGFPF